MTELNKPKITIDELLQKVRVEILQIPGYDYENNSISSITDPITAENISYVDSFLNNAELRSNIRNKWPDKYNRFPFNLSKKIQSIALKVLQIIFVDQREVNFSLIQALRKSTLVNQSLVEEIIELKTQIKALEEKFVSQLDRHNSDRQKSIELTKQHLNAADNKIAELSDRYVTNSNQVKALDRQINNLHKQVVNDYSYLKNESSQQKRLISLFLEETSQRLSDKLVPEQLHNSIEEKQHLFDAFYVAFEDRFRGSREEIADRLKVYLPWIEAAKVGTQELPILDIGCGRGEWLELLNSSGFIARGLDMNRVMVEQCQSRGLDIVEADALTYLQSLPTASLGAVTGFHIIEHLPFDLLIKLLNETNRVLASGGIAIFETPNPDNVLVGSGSFYIDPTHHNPLPSQTINFVVSYCNFDNVQILNLNRSDIPNIAENSEIAQRFNEYFYGYRDYAVIGFKR